MIASQLEQILFEELGFAGRPELKTGDSIPWPTGRAIPDVDSAFFLNNIPLAYFSRLSDLDEDRITQLHRNVWSQSKAPLLFVTLPHEIRIYNGYHQPDDDGRERPDRLLQQLTNLTDRLQAQQIIKQLLVEENHYERIYLETGAFWNTTEGRRIDYETRADKQLVEGMGQMRKLLTEAGLSNQVAYTLLGRSIFIRYLEDRGALSNEWVAKATEGVAQNYREALENGRSTTYHLFEALSRRFNGDLFPVEAEETAVTETHLGILLAFLNRTNLATGQLSLWPYNFAYIPIELISHIYDTFIEDQRSSGAYYTPLLLADFMLEETMGDDVIRPDMMVLDPACGSGIFLVGAFRRLAQAWRRQYGQMTPADLQQILRHSIYGVDKKREAVRIAAFSLYLEILNHLTNEQIQDASFRFPTLARQNLLDSDFFAAEVDTHFADQKFDRIIGNLPWGKGTLTPLANEWLKAAGHIVGGKQAAPAFMLRVPQFCNEQGEIAVLVPTKSSILVTSDTHRTFRDRFFSTYHVRAVVNFSVIRHELFDSVVSPVTAVFYSSHVPDWNSKLVYAVPKPSPLSQRLKAIVLDTTEIKFLDHTELQAQPHLWKIAQWGTPRDAALIERLQSVPTLGEQAENLGWTIGEGIQINGGDKNSAPWLENLPLLPTNKFSPYFLNSEGLETITATVFHRPRTPKLVQAPLVLIHQSECAAAYSNMNVAYRDKISGVAGGAEKEWLLKWLVAYINSPLARYFHFLTSTSWAVERGTIIQWEYETMPFLVPEEGDPRLQTILHHMAQIEALLPKKSGLFFNLAIEASQREHEKAIHKLVYELYGLHPVEQQLVEDMLTYGIPFFEWAKSKRRKQNGAKPVKTPDSEMLSTYADVFSRTANSLLRIKNQTLNATIYKNGAPLTVVSFTLVPLNEAQPVQTVDEHDAMRAKLRELDTSLLERNTPSMYMRRHVRVYDGNTVSLVRPSEQRFWTQSQARADADAFLAELSSF